MSRSGYDNDLGDNWDVIRWRGAVASAIKGRRGQAFLKELKEAMLALPEKKLTGDAFASGGQVCALGSVVLSRKLAAGVDREMAMKEIEAEWPEDPEECEFLATKNLGVAGALAKEIMYINDEGQCFEAHEAPEKRYTRVLEWVQEQIRE